MRSIDAQLASSSSHTFFPHSLPTFLVAWGSLTNWRFAGLSSSPFRLTVIYGFQSDPFAGKCSPNAVPACPANLLGNYVAALLRSILNFPPPKLSALLSISLSLSLRVDPQMLQLIAFMLPSCAALPCLTRTPCRFSIFGVTAKTFSSCRICASNDKIV